MVTLRELKEKKQTFYFPGAFKDRKKIEIDTLRTIPSWDMDAEPIIRRTPQIDPETKQPKINEKTGKPYYDDMAYIPVLIGDEKQVWVSASPLILRLIRSIEVHDFDDPDHAGQILQIAEERIEGKLKVGSDRYRYGEKGEYSVDTITEA